VAAPSYGDRSPSRTYQTTLNGITYHVAGSIYYRPVFSNGQVKFKVT